MQFFVRGFINKYRCEIHFLWDDEAIDRSSLNLTTHRYSGGSSRVLPFSSDPSFLGSSGKSKDSNILDEYIIMIRQLVPTTNFLLYLTASIFSKVSPGQSSASFLKPFTHSFNSASASIAALHPPTMISGIDSLILSKYLNFYLLISRYHVIKWRYLPNQKKNQNKTIAIPKQTLRNYCEEIFYVNQLWNKHNIYNIIFIRLQGWCLPYAAEAKRKALDSTIKIKLWIRWLRWLYKQ